LPNSFLVVSKFIWIMKTFSCNFGADVFAWLFELFIVPDVIKVDDGQYLSHPKIFNFKMWIDRIIK
jgi:hypothetical protein